MMHILLEPVNIPACASVRGCVCVFNAQCFHSHLPFAKCMTPGLYSRLNQAFLTRWSNHPFLATFMLVTSSADACESRVDACARARGYACARAQHCHLWRPLPTSITYGMLVRRDIQWHLLSHTLIIIHMTSSLALALSK